MVEEEIAKPKWLIEFRKRTALIDLIDKAFDPSVSDKEIRETLKRIAKDLGELFFPSK